MFFLFFLTYFDLTDRGVDPFSLPFVLNEDKSSFKSSPSPGTSGKDGALSIAVGEISELRLLRFDAINRIFTQFNHNLKRLR